MRARVTVTLKSGVLDPQGKAIEGALASLGIEGVAGVRQGKVFDVVLTATDPDAARAALERACSRLLANTVIENYRIDIASEGPSDARPVADAAPRAPDAGLAGSDAAAPPSIGADPSMPPEGHP